MEHELEPENSRDLRPFIVNSVNSSNCPKTAVAADDFITRAVMRRAASQLRRTELPAPHPGALCILLCAFLETSSVSKEI